MLFFFLNILVRVGKERNSGLKFFSLFLGLSHPDLDRNNEGMMFFNILNFFAIFSSNFLAQVVQERNLGLNFFFSLSAYLIPVWIEEMNEWCFLILQTFLLFFF